MKLAISEVCSLDAPLETDVEEYAGGGCTAIELWVGKLDAYLEHHAPAELVELLARYEMSAPVASFQGGILASQGEFRREHWRTFSRRLAQCQALGVATLVVAADIPGPLDQQALDRVRVSLAEAATQAARHGVRLALEFQAQAAFINNLQTAAAVVAEVASPALGICLDLFHYYTGPSKPEDFSYLTAENLFHVQLSDLADVAREFASDGDRILPGDGDVDAGPLVAHLRAIDYQGCVSVELMNPQIWRVPPRQFGDVAMAALRRAIGQ